VALFHRLLAFAIVGALLLLTVWGTALRVAGRDTAPKGFWGLLHYTENVLAVEIVAGIILLLIGRRQPWLHYVYGSVFPIMVLVAARMASLRREVRDYAPIAFGAFFAFGLTARALMLGMGWNV